MMRLPAYARIIFFLLMMFPGASLSQVISLEDSLRVAQWKFLARQCLILQVPEQAIRFYDSVLSLQPSDFDAHYGIAEACYGLGLNAAALSHLDFLKESYPGNADVIEHRAFTLHAMGRNAEALREINRYVRMKPEDPEGWYLKGKIQKNKVEETSWLIGRESSYDDAIRNLEKAISLSGGIHYAAYVVLGNIYANVKQRDRALEYYRLAISRDSTAGLPHVLIGQQALSVKDTALALAEFDTALNKQPASMQVQEMVNRSLFEMGYYATVERRLDLLLTIDSSRLDAWMGKGLLHMYRKAYREAIACYDRAIAAHPNAPEPYYMRGLCRLALKDSQKAGEDLRYAAGLGHPKAAAVLKSDLRYRESWLPFLSDIARYYPWWLHY